MSLALVSTSRFLPCGASAATGGPGGADGPGAATGPHWTTSGD
ncbi:hypothetical protein VTH82DRAFT_7264 [Thermothelomyces myriococcoides]